MGPRALPMWLSFPILLCGCRNFKSSVTGYPRSQHKRKAQAKAWEDGSAGNVYAVKHTKHSRKESVTVVYQPVRPPVPVRDLVSKNKLDGSLETLPRLASSLLMHTIAPLQTDL